MASMNILIAAPCYRETIFAETCGCLIKLALALQTSGAQFTIDMTSGADVVWTRNFYGTRILNDRSFSHLLFIDNDMAFRTAAIFELIKTEKPFVGLAYPTRHLDVDKLLEVGKTKTLRQAMAAASKFAFTPHPNEAPSGLMKVAGIGMGVTLIAREVFDHIHATGNLTERDTQGAFAHRGLRGPLYGFFDYIQSLSEDMSFCHRWTDLGGEIFALTTESVGHIGIHTYRARAADLFES